MLFVPNTYPPIPTYLPPPPPPTTRNNHYHSSRNTCVRMMRILQTRGTVRPIRSPIDPTFYTIRNRRRTGLSCITCTGVRPVANSNPCLLDSLTKSTTDSLPCPLPPPPPLNHYSRFIPCRVLPIENCVRTKRFPDFRPFDSIDPHCPTNMMMIPPKHKRREQQTTGRIIIIKSTINYLTIHNYIPSRHWPYWALPWMMMMTTTILSWKKMCGMPWNRPLPSHHPNEYHSGVGFSHPPHCHTRYRPPPPISYHHRRDIDEPARS